MKKFLLAAPLQASFLVFKSAKDKLQERGAS